MLLKCNVILNREKMSVLHRINDNLIGKLILQFWVLEVETESQNPVNNSVIRLGKQPPAGLNWNLVILN